LTLLYRNAAGQHASANVDRNEASDQELDTWASLVLQTSIPGLESAPVMAVDEWTNHFDGTVIHSDDEGDILAYTNAEVLAFEGSFGNDKSNEERWSVGNIDHLCAHRSTTYSGCSLLSAVKRTSTSYPTKDPVIVSSTFTFSAQSIEFDDLLVDPIAALDSPDISDVITYPICDDTQVDYSAVVELPAPLRLLSTPLRR
jgi:hypothetical protein